MLRGNGIRFGAWLALAGAALVLPVVAAADVIPGSVSQVGAWRVGAYTRNQTSIFDHCSIYRVQNQGFGLALGYNAKTAWSMAAEAPDWGLTPKETYTATIQVGETSFTATGRALDGGRALIFNVAPEIYGQLKTGRQLSIASNNKRYAISLDGVEAAAQRARECVQQYATGTQVPAPPAQPSGQGSPAGAAPQGFSPLVASIQNLLVRLGYDPGPINGVTGIKTNMAISAFQKSIGERGDGNPTEAVRGQLERAVASRSAPGNAPGSAPGNPPVAAAPPSGRPEPPKEGKGKTVASTGTGFFISKDTLITNAHVTNGCTELRLRKSGADLGPASVVATNRADDLAALRSQTPAKSFLKLRIGAPIKPAEPVLVFGYPLAEALSSAGNTTLGNVTALSGMRDDSRFLQISAAVQPGNSGGPAVDEAGRLMGVVVSKLNAVNVARITGDIPQNVNFAIKVTTLVNFLETNQIGYEAADANAHELPVTERAQRAEASSAQVECFK